MKYSEKASKYLELCGIDSPTHYQAEKLSQLRRELSAIGLDPQHPNGLTYRALVYDNKRLIETFLDLCDSKKDTLGLGRQLHRFGIDINKKAELRRILASFKTNAKVIDRKKTVKSIGLGRMTSDAVWQQEEDEMIGEEIAAKQNRAAMGSYA